MTILTNLNCKAICLEIAKKDPLLIVEAFNGGIKPPKQHKLDDKSWNEFEWYHSVLELIKSNKMMAAQRYLYQSEEDISDAEAMSIIREIKATDIDPVLPHYSRFKKVRGNYQVIAFDDTIIAGGTTKQGAALRAWDWHKEQIKKDRLTPSWDSETIWVGRR